MKFLILLSHLFTGLAAPSAFAGMFDGTYSAKRTALPISFISRGAYDPEPTANSDEVVVRIKGYCKKNLASYSQVYAHANEIRNAQDCNRGTVLYTSLGDGGSGEYSTYSSNGSDLYQRYRISFADRSKLEMAILNSSQKSIFLFFDKNFILRKVIQ